LGIGTFSRVKRWDRLIRAAAQLKQRRLQFAVKLVGDGPLRHELEEQVSRLQMRDCFEFVTRTDAIPTMLSESTMLVHTSESEGCPNVVMEAMACGRPLVATDAGDIPSLVEDGTCGFVIRRGDDEALTLKVETLLNDRALCRRMGEAGRLKAEREFSLSRLIDDTLVAYNAAGWKGF
jgi:glycosyltransferase involved in cell wall biosynthesis